jgi:hypothetical protein
MAHTSKLVTGCGGCSCLFSLLAIPAGLGMMAMINDSHLSELGPFGFVVTPLGFMAMMLGVVLVGVGLFMGKKNQDADGQ